MSIQRSLLFKSLVKPYYRQNAGLFCFVFFIMFLAVGTGLLECHYSLILGMMINPSFFMAVLAVWLMYAIKCSQFITRTFRKAEFSWLYMLSLVNPGKVYGLLLLVQLVFFLPVLSYLVIILGVGYHQHWYAQSNVALLFNLFICAASAYWYLYLLQKPGTTLFAINWKLPLFTYRKNYSNFLFLYLFENSKVLFLVIKIYNCVTLYLMLDNRNPSEDKDLRMTALFYSIGMLGHGMLIHRLKEMENARLAFCRGLPVSLTRRFVQYGWFYLCVLIPEIVIIASRTPAYLYYSEAFFFVFLGYGILMLLNSLQLFNYAGLKDYLVTIAQLLFAVIVGMIGNCLREIGALIFLFSIIIFFRRYYRFEPDNKNTLQAL
jgi:hypothetical protein